MLVRAAQAQHTATTQRSTVPRPYVPLGTVAVGLLVAYRAWSEYARMDGQDVLVTFVFVFALLALLGLRFFIVDRFSDVTEGQPPRAAESVRVEPVDTGSDGPWRA